MTGTRRVALVSLAVGVLVAGCTSSGSSGGAASTSASTSASAPVAPSSSGPSCPPSSGGQAWPKEAPAGLPVPSGLQIVSVQRQPNVVIRFAVPDDFHTTVRYLLGALRAAGFTLGTGDSEAEEADIPFSKGAAHASIKVNDDGKCSTVGLLAVGTD